MPGGGAIFRLDSHGDSWSWDFHPIRPDEARDGDDVAALVALDPPPKSRRDVADRLGWGTNRAGKALAAYRARSGTTLPLHTTTEGA